MTWRTFLLPIFGNLIGREEIPHTGSSSKCQLITHTVIILFYRHKKINYHFVIGCINHKIKYGLIHFTPLNGICEDKSTVTHKPIHNPSINQQVQTVAPGMKYLLRLFDGNINTGNPQFIKINLQETKEIDKESEKLYIPVSNAKDIIDHFRIIFDNYGWGSLAFMVETGACANYIFKAGRAYSDCRYAPSITWIIWTARHLEILDIKSFQNL